MRLDFQRLAAEESLAHAYVFSGEKNIGKFSFAKALGNYLENGSFELPKENMILTECLIIERKTKESLGIDQIREIKRFLSEKPVKGKKRLVIINDAEYLSGQAANALLKVLEEPPESGVIILVTRNPEALIPTIRSRAQVVHFNRVGEKTIADWLAKEKGMSKAEAEKLAAISFGQPGLAVEISETEKENYALAEKFLGNPSTRSDIIRQLLDSEANISDFLEALLTLLRRGGISNSHPALKSVLQTLTGIMDYNLNKRLQLEAMASNF